MQEVPGDAVRRGGVGGTGFAADDAAVSRSASAAMLRQHVASITGNIINLTLGFSIKPTEGWGALT